MYINQFPHENVGFTCDFNQETWKITQAMNFIIPFSVNCTLEVMAVQVAIFNV
jgi:hypothetical protein